MTENPYEPVPDLGTPEVEEARDVGPPRFRGAPMELSVTIDESEAIWQIRHAEAVPIEAQVKSQPTNWVGVISLLLFTAFGIAILQFAPQAVVTSLGLVCIGGIVVLIGLIAAAWLFGSIVGSPKRADPPVGGQRIFRFNALGWSVQHPFRDGRWHELFCSWRQTQVQQSKSETAWMLHTGINRPLVFLRSWVHDLEQSIALEKLMQDIAEWRQEHPYTGILSDVPDEAAESFPNPDGISFKSTGGQEQRNQRELRKRHRAHLPSLAPERKIQLLKLLFGLLALCPVFLAVAWCFGIHSTYSTALFFPLVPTSILIVAIWWRLHKNVSLQETVGTLSAHDLWLNYRAAMIRFPLEGFPQRFMLQDGKFLMLESADRKSSFVLDRTMFSRDDEFQAACTLVGARDFQMDSERS